MTKVAIMQPYFFPYLGYFSLIKHTDRFVLFDTVQFIRHGWIERNRILKQDDGWIYIKVPLVKASRGASINESYIDNSQSWKNKIVAQLQPYKKTGTYYRQTIAVVEKIFSEDFDSVTMLNKRCLEEVCAYLGIERQISIFSEMNLDVDHAEAPDEWALKICEKMGDVDEYWNPPGGQMFFDKSKYDAVGIKLVFQSVKLQEYDQKRVFEPGLSILDVMMFNSPEEINKMLDHYEIG